MSALVYLPSVVSWKSSLLPSLTEDSAEADKAWSTQRPVAVSPCEVPWVRASYPPLTLGHAGKLILGAFFRTPYGRVTLDQSRGGSETVASRGELRPH